MTTFLQISEGTCVVVLRGSIAQSPAEVSVCACERIRNYNNITWFEIYKDLKKIMKPAISAFIYKKNKNQYSVTVIDEACKKMLW